MTGGIEGVEGGRPELFVVNAAFDQFTLGEIVRADPAMFADEIAAGLLQRVDERGDRIVEIPAPSDATDEGNVAPEGDTES